MGKQARQEYLAAIRKRYHLAGEHVHFKTAKQS